MWEISLNNQLLGFGVSILLGAVLCAFYDIFRAKRKIINSSAIVIFFEDIFYFFVISIIVFCFLLPLTNGNLRAYVIIGICIGFTICRLTISKLIVPFFSAIIKFVIKLKTIINGYKTKILFIFLTMEEKIRKIFASFFKKVIKLEKKA